MEREDQIAKLKRHVDQLATRIDRGLKFLNDLAQRIGQDSPEFERYFSEWEKLLAEESGALDQLERLGVTL